jgi:hypothetical protein
MRLRNLFWSRSMSEELNNNRPALDHNDYEREDLSPTGVMYFMVGLVVVVIAIYVIVDGMYHFLDRTERANQANMSPIVTPNPDTRAITPQDPLSFPQPRLETDERSQLNDYIQKQDQKLMTYDWLDKDSGIVRIPIDRAMDLIAERGLPVRTESNSAVAPTPAKKELPAKSAAKGATAPDN